jgi:ribose 5-phosphate isomerase RpiB
MHNDANVISIGQRMMDEATALEIVRVWLDTRLKADVTSRASRCLTNSFHAAAES